MTSQTEQQIITKHTLSNTLRSKFKFNQLIKYNMRTIFPEKLSTECCREAAPRPFYVKS